MTVITTPFTDPLQWEEGSEELDPNYAWTAEVGDILYAVSYPYPHAVSDPPPDLGKGWLAEVVVMYDGTFDTELSDSQWFATPEQAKAFCQGHHDAQVHGPIDHDNAIDDIHHVLSMAGSNYTADTFVEIAEICRRALLT